MSEEQELEEIGKRLAELPSTYMFPVTALGERTTAGFYKIDQHTLYPVPIGNTFHFWLGKDLPQLKCENMHAENFDEAVRRFLPDGLVEVALRAEAGVFYANVVDSRVPGNWKK